MRDLNRELDRKKSEIAELIAARERVPAQIAEVLSEQRRMMEETMEEQRVHLQKLVDDAKLEEKKVKMRLSETETALGQERTENGELTVRLTEVEAALKVSQEAQERLWKATKQA